MSRTSGIYGTADYLQRKESSVRTLKLRRAECGVDNVCRLREVAGMMVNVKS